MFETHSSETGLLFNFHFTPIFAKKIVRRGLRRLIYILKCFNMSNDLYLSSISDKNSNNLLSD